MLVTFVSERRLCEAADELLAIGYVTARVIECVFIAGGIIGVVSLREDSPETADLAGPLAALREVS